MTISRMAPVLYAKKPEVMAAGVSAALVFLEVLHQKKRKKAIPRIATHHHLLLLLLVGSEGLVEDSHIIEPENQMSV